jgi:hypothetical protein
MSFVTVAVSATVHGPDENCAMVGGHVCNVDGRYDDVYIEWLSGRV